MHTLASLMLIALLPSDAGAMASPERRLPTDSTIRFPKVAGSNLEGRRFSLPADFEAEFNIVLLAFRREQQADVDSWLPFLEAQNVRERGMRVYELPTLARSYRMLRSFIDGGMARGIPAKATREATITLYINKQPFKKALAIDAEDHIRTMIVTRDGQVLWRAVGSFTPEAGADLSAMLDTLRGPAAP